MAMAGEAQWLKGRARARARLADRLHLVAGIKKPWHKEIWLHIFRFQDKKMVHALT